MQNRYINKSLDLDLNVLRGVAAVLVFTWHYLHWGTWNEAGSFSTYVPFFSEGHVGVSLFMVISGYLFISLTFNRNVNWTAFWKNRALRILPLLIFTQILWLAFSFAGFSENPFNNFLWKLLFSNMDGGAWSIVTEAHFYLILPLILFVIRNQGEKILYLLAFAVTLEIFSYFLLNRDYTYHSITGRLVQFLLGGSIFIF